MHIADAPRGGRFRVLRVDARGEVGRRLADMGFTVGAEGAVVRRGWWRGPLHIRLRGYDLLIRRSEALSVAVELVGAAI
jgi:ferrous iron transport protein A